MSTSKFKVGDLVRCTNQSKHGSSSYLALGGLYVVGSVAGDYFKMDLGDEWYSMRRFELVTPGGVVRAYESPHAKAKRLSVEAAGLNAPLELKTEASTTPKCLNCGAVLFSADPCPCFSATPGIKHDAEKPDLSLLSSEALMQIGAAMTYGKRKYNAHNWRKGLHWSRVLAAAMRHLVAYIGGEDKDPETGLSHLAHCACCLMMVLEFERTHKALDDRYKP